jgi:hypothetical protein
MALTAHAMATTVPADMQETDPLNFREARVRDRHAEFPPQPFIVPRGIKLEINIEGPANLTVLQIVNDTQGADDRSDHDERISHFALGHVSTGTQILEVAPYEISVWLGAAYGRNFTMRCLRLPAG